MASNTASQFPDLLSAAPPIFRDFLSSALQVKDLEALYATARQATGSGSISKSALKLLNVTIDVSPHDVERIPRTGPIIIVANHPFGFLDGLVLDAVLGDRRSDIKTLINSLLCSVDELRDRCIAIDVMGQADAMSNNLKSLRRSIQWLRQGGGLAIFPAGEVSHWRMDRRRIADPPWSKLAARCAVSTGTSVVPVYFAGTNSLAFQMAGFLHPRLRTARLPRELFNKRNSRVGVRIGAPIPASELPGGDSGERATAYLRARTYMLGYRKPVTPSVDPGGAFLKTQAGTRGIASETPGIADAIAALGSPLVENASYAVYAARGDRIPLLLREVGRLREVAFRAVGEGTGRAIDLDAFDSYYTHLILWNKTDLAIAGSYRLAWTEDVFPVKGVAGLYTSTLFRYAPQFFSKVGPSVELGRSFISLPYQREYAPLFMLWQGIAQLIAARPGSPVLFGPVSISADYSQASRELMVSVLRDKNFRGDLQGLVVPRAPFKSRFLNEPELKALKDCLNCVDDLTAPIADLDQASGVPVLLRQYLRLGGRVAAFNVDKDFSGALDGLLIVDTRETPSKLLAKYMGTEACAAFLAKQNQMGTTASPLAWVSGESHSALHR